MDSNWISANYEYLQLPIHIKCDNKYFQELKDRYDRILTAFNSTELSILSHFSNQILESITAYYKNNTIESYELIHNLLLDLSKDPCSSLCFSKLKDCAIPKTRKGDSQFFRAREGTSYIEYPANEMGYVPFEQRTKCAENRYSLAGIPCLYLGNTSYVCWLEMNRPSDDKFCVSPFYIDSDLSFFNIAIPIFRLKEAIDRNRRDEFMFLMKAYLLEIATSFCIEQSDRHFHSEYIVSQNIMKSCIRQKQNGIIFYTTRAVDNLLSLVCGINIALYIDFNDNEKKSIIFEEKTEHGDSVNYAMFKNLLSCQNCERYNLAVDQSDFIANIGNIDNQIKYSETQFHEFDNYIFTHWKRAKDKAKIMNNN